MRKVTITVPSRIHFGLCDLRPVTVFANGGAGVGIDQPCAQVICSTGSGHVFLEGTAAEWRNEIDVLLTSLRSIADIANLDIAASSEVPVHSGFGSHTALSLGIVEAVGLATGEGWTEKQIVELSGRGRTSGVGVQTYFHGGVAYDFGTPKSSGEFLPSSASRAQNTPIFGHHISFPDSWRILMSIPHGLRIYGREEVEFFRRNTPLDEGEALRAIAYIHHGVIPSILSSDLRSLATSLKLLHASGFKALELKAQSKSVQGVYNALAGRGVACGMSSFGPLIYAIVDCADVDTQELFSLVATEHSAQLLHPTISSQGRKVSML